MERAIGTQRGVELFSVSLQHAEYGLLGVQMTEFCFGNDVLWTSSIRNSRPYGAQECPLERDFCTFSLENLDLYYVLDVSFIRIEWFWRPWRRRGTI